MKTFKVEVGGKSSKKLKKMYEDSHFLSPEFDCAIMGVNPVTGSVIYYLNEVVDITMKDEYGDNLEEDDYDDAYDNCLELVYGMFNSFEYLDSKVAPTLFEELN